MDIATTLRATLQTRVEQASQDTATTLRATLQARVAQAEQMSAELDSHNSYPQDRTVGRFAHLATGSSNGPSQIAGDEIAGPSARGAHPSQSPSARGSGPDPKKRKLSGTKQFDTPEEKEEAKRQRAGASRGKKAAQAGQPTPSSSAAEALVALTSAGEAVPGEAVGTSSSADAAEENHESQAEGPRPFACRRCGGTDHQYSTAKSCPKHPGFIPKASAEAEGKDLAAQVARLPCAYRRRALSCL